MNLAEYESCFVLNENFELDEGELVRVSPTALPHAKRSDRIYRYLTSKLPEEQYDILPGELGFILSIDPTPTVRGADLAVMYRDDNPGPGFVKEAPLLVIEVVSPGNAPEDMERKRVQYLKAGTREVWIVYEKAKTMHVFQQNGVGFFVCDEKGSFRCLFDFTVEGKEIFR